jgi:hypothetical protein
MLENLTHDRKVPALDFRAFPARQKWAIPIAARLDWRIVDRFILRDNEARPSRED